MGLLTLINDMSNQDITTAVDEDIAIELNRVISVCKTIVDNYSDFIIEIGVSPAECLLKRIKEIGSFGFHIVYNEQACDSSNISMIKEELHEMLESIIGGELEGVSSINKTEFMNGVTSKTHYVPIISQLSSLTKDNILSFLDNYNKELLEALRVLCIDCNLEISIPANIQFAKTKHVVAHFNSYVDCIAFTQDCNKKSGLFGIWNFSTISKPKKGSISIIPVVGDLTTECNLPYIKISKEDFSTKSSEEISTQSEE
ncbi:MAG: hypothetical protein IKL53_08155 [Lachnospiraceae bacterium]|nr:hypothetical protein [Lachnospiraceae bacterium]